MRIARILIAAIMFLACLAIFLDFTGILPRYIGWAAQIQFIPALLALNAVALIILLLLTLLFGRIYCSIICPLGIFQDIFSGLRGKKSKYKFWKQTKAVRAIRYSIMGIFMVMLIAGLIRFAVFIEPYSAFGRMAEGIISPLYDFGNNTLADIAQEKDSYTFSHVDIWIRGTASFVLAIITFIGLAIAAVVTGRGYCNTVCPAGTLLGLMSRFSLFKVRIDEDKCKRCMACSNKCKGHCIDIKSQTIDSERCVTCMNCLTSCKHDAIHFTPSLKNMIMKKEKTSAAQTNESVQNEAPENGVNSAEDNVKEERTATETNRRAFLKTAAAGAAGAAGALLCPALSQAETTETGQKEPYPRETRITPPGSQGHSNFDRKCVGCKLCVRACHNHVLRADTFTPTLSFERGYCRPTCNDCSQVCPTGAILPITLERKSSTQIGRAQLKSDICLSASKGIHCRACSRICPSGAITFVASKTPDGKPCKIPNVNIERCIGCGACEYACPAKPLSAIHVEGNIQHHEI